MTQEIEDVVSIHLAGIFRHFAFQGRVPDDCHTVDLDGFVVFSNSTVAPLRKAVMLTITDPMPHMINGLCFNKDGVVSRTWAVQMMTSAFDALAWTSALWRARNASSSVAQHIHLHLCRLVLLLLQQILLRDS